MSTFNERFRTIKDENGYTLKQLAELTGLKVANLSYYLNNRDPNYEVLCIIADTFDVTIDWLIGRSNQRKHESEGFISEMKKAAENPLKNDAKVMMIEQYTVDFYNDLVNLANAETPETDLRELWAITDELISLIGVIAVFAEELGDNPYPIELANSIQKISLAQEKTVSAVLFRILKPALLENNEKVSIETKEKIINLLEKSY